MGNQSVISIEAVIDYIESHLDGKLELETVAEAVHYSKYHLHRLFTETVGMTIHDYVQRRQLTEAAKLLVFSDKPIIEIAFICGYESQQSFSLAFKAMYKSPPAEYREERSFYPLQLRFILHRRTTAMEFTMFDVDDFKQVNDCHGHVKGDLCLAGIAECIKKAYADFGYCYRIGGDEFCVLLKNRAKEEECRQEFLRRWVEKRRKFTFLPTVSYGSAPFSGEDIAVVKDRADQDMYQYKKGRKKHGSSGVLSK